MLMHNFFYNVARANILQRDVKTTIQSGGRISIPEAERQALKIDDGDLVQVIIIPIIKKKKR